MYIIVKFIDAIIVLAILLIITLTVLNADSYSSMLGTPPEMEHVATTPPNPEEPLADSDNIADNEDVITKEGA